MIDLTTDLAPGPQARGLAVASAIAAQGDEGRLAECCDAWFAAKLDPAVLCEGMFQLYLFCGYPRALNALRVYRQREAATGIGPAAEISGGDDPDRAAARARGEAVCAKVYGVRYRALLQRVDALHPVLSKQMVEEGYGRILGRPGMEPVWREIATVGALVPLQVDRQVRAHLRGALNLGASVEDLKQVLADLRAVCPHADVDRATALLQEFDED
ncbi:MAG: carboxymuconolactone decarboxylase family protein [Planctomycetota bacterium]